MSEVRVFLCYLLLKIPLFHVPCTWSYFVKVLNPAKNIQIVQTPRKIICDGNSEESNIQKGIKSASKALQI